VREVYEAGVETADLASVAVVPPLGGKGGFEAAGEPRAGELISFTVTADGFLYNMVRTMVGTLIDVGRGKTPPEDLPGVLEGRDRRLAGPTAPPMGLWLVGVEYSD
jgi:tRNA pseudouridine38-40 synthase